MPTRAVLFDLDDTLVRDTDATWAALRATAELAAPRGLDAEALAQTAHRGAKEAWKRSLYRPYFEEFGISEGECLWGRFVGEDPRLRSIGAWAARMQLDCWAGALGTQGTHDDVLAATLAERFRVERRARHGWLYPEIRVTLEALEERYALALVTNGAPDIQRDKLAGSGLEGYFATVQVSCEAGAGKPDPAIFFHALEALDATADETAMVGDNPATDITGANRAGIRAIWLRRAHQHLTQGARPDVTIVSLSELPALL